LVMAALLVLTSERLLICTLFRVPRKIYLILLEESVIAQMEGVHSLTLVHGIRKKVERLLMKFDKKKREREKSMKRRRVVVVSSMDPSKA
jgi:hypothetical protein